MVRATGAAERLNDMITERVADAQDALADVPVGPSVRAALGELAARAAWRVA